MRRLASIGLLVCGLALLAVQPAAADWWPFGKSDKKPEQATKKKVSANTPVKPTATTTAKKSTSWNPFSSEKAKPSNSYVSPYSGVGSSYGKKAPEKKGWLSSMFQKEEPPQKLNSVDDFMKLERPSP